MEKLKLETKNVANENFELLSKLFPNALTETIIGYDEDGKAIVDRAIDADVLRQEIACTVVEGKEERYQFTWPDKKKAILNANAPISETLRPCREESVDFDNTENLYIEGDNLDVLKLLQETYLGKVKMIYIDPPYNTGSDLIYDDDFSETYDDYITNSNQLDAEGNRLFQNTESNGRFHTDWLNMIYPRIKLSRNLLTEDGVLFISIGDEEVDNLRKLCDEIYGRINFVGVLLWKKKTNGNNMGYLPAVHDYILCYAKSISSIKDLGFPITQEYISKTFSNPDNDVRGPWTTTDLSANHKGPCYPITNPNTGEIHYPPKGRYWVFNEKEVKNRIIDGRIIFGKNGKGKPVQKVFLSNRKLSKIKVDSWWDDKGMNEDATEELTTIFGAAKLFTHPKPTKLLYNIQKLYLENEDIIIDFFSGSATTANATMLLNAEDTGKRRYIMVQLPELTDTNSEAYKAGYHNICEIGKERIRRAGKKILEENPDAKDLDIGFRVLKLDSTNMKEVYYTPSETQQTLFDLYTDNIKPDRTPEDLLFQVMLDLGVLLSSKIEETEIAGKKVFNVADGFLIACFDDRITDEVVKAVAQRKPYYAVFRDSSMADDSVATNFEQIFVTYSPETIRKVL